MFRLHFQSRSDMENETDSQRSPTIPPDRWRRHTSNIMPPSSLTPHLTEHLMMKRAIKHWPTPRHPAYSTIAARLQSFKTWPYSESQTPESLSEAGFYYTGKNTFFKIIIIFTHLLKERDRVSPLFNLTLFLSRYRS